MCIGQLDKSVGFWRWSFRVVIFETAVYLVLSDRRYIMICLPDAVNSQNPTRDHHHPPPPSLSPASSAEFGPSGNVGTGLGIELMMDITWSPEKSEKFGKHTFCLCTASRGLKPLDINQFFQVAQIAGTCRAPLNQLYWQCKLETVLHMRQPKVIITAVISSDNQARTLILIATASVRYLRNDLFWWNSKCRCLRTECQQAPRSRSIEFGSYVGFHMESRSEIITHIRQHWH